MAIKFDITGDNRNVLESFKGVQNGVRDMQNAVEKSGMSIEDVFRKIQSAAAMTFAGVSAKEFAQNVMKVRGEFQQLEVAFSTMLQSEEKASALMNQLLKTAAITPFDLKGVADGAKQLLAYGIAADEVNDTLVHLGDIAAGLSVPLGDLVYLYGTTMVQGRMFTQDLRQLQGRGVPIADQLAKQFGVAKDKVGELVTAGKVGAEDFKKAMMDMSAEGGRFGGLMEKQSKTISGQISNIEDSIDMMFNNIGKQSEGIINGSLSIVSSLVENYEKVGKAIASVVAVYGTYKAAVITVTALQSLQATGIMALTTKEAVHYGWLVLVDKAQKMLNATLLANPYVLVATLIAGMTVALMNMKSQQDLVNEATDEYNRKKDEAIEKEEEHKRRIEELISIAGDESLSTDARKEALVRLERQYPSIFEKYDTEADKLNNILKIKREIAALDGKNSVSSPTNELANVNKRILELEKKGRAQYTAYSTQTGASYQIQTGGRSAREEAELISLRNRRNAIQRDLDSKNVDAYLANLTGISNTALEAQISERRSLLAKMQATERRYGKVNRGGAKGVFSADDLQAQIQIMQAELNKRNEKKFTPAQLKSQAKAALDKARKELAEFDKTSTVYGEAEAEAERKKLQDAVDEAEKLYKKRGGKVGGKSGKSEADSLRQMQRYHLLEEQQKREHERQMVDIELSTAQAEIDAMEESTEKTMKQIDLDFKKRGEEIKRAYEDLKLKKIENARSLWEANPANKNKPFDESTVDTSYTTEEEENNKKQMEANLAEHRRRSQEVAQQELQALHDYLKEYGTVEQRRYAITKEYDNKIAKEKSENRRKILEAEKQSALSQVNAQSMAMNIDWNQTFTGIGNVLQGIARDTLSKVREYMGTDEYKGLGAADKKAYQDLVQQLVDAGGVEASSPFKASTWNEIGKLGEAYKKSVQEVLTAQTQHKAAVDNLIKAERELEKATTPTAKAMAEANVKIAQKAVEDTADNLQNKEENKDNANQKLKNATDSASQGLNNFSTVLGQITSGTLSGFATGVYNLVKSISGSGEKAAASLGEIGGKAGGLIGAIIQIIDALGDDPEKFISDLLARVAKIIERILSDLPQIIGSVFEGVFNIVGGVVSGVGKLFGFDMGGIFGGTTENFDRATEKWGWLLDTWQDNLEYEKKLMKEAYGTDVTDIKAKTEQQLLDTQKAAAEMYRAWASDGAGWFSHSNGYNANEGARWDYLWNYDEELAKKMGAHLENLFGIPGIQYIANGNVGNLFDLSAKELEGLKYNNRQFWESLDETARKYLDMIIEAEGEIAKLEEEAHEQLTGISFDSVESNFKSKLSNMDSEAKDFSEDFEGYMREAVISALMISTYKEQLKKWYKDFADAMSSDSKLTEDEEASLRQQYDDIVNAAIEERNRLRDTLGLEMDEYKQEASSKGFNAMSQDMGEELSGRFTAVQIAAETIAQQMMVVVATINSFASFSQSNNTAVMEIRNMMIMTNSYLEDVVKYAKLLYNDFGQKLDAITANTRSL